MDGTHVDLYIFIICASEIAVVTLQTCRRLTTFLQYFHFLTHTILFFKNSAVVLEEFFKMVFKGQASVHGFLTRPQKTMYST